MSIRKAIGWLFDVGDGREGEALKAARALEQEKDEGDGEIRLYGEAEAIRVLYQAGLTDGGSPKPPRPKRGRGVWVARYLDSFVPSLRDPSGAKA
jgi:hypothetical protein